MSYGTGRLQSSEGKGGVGLTGRYDDPDDPTELTVFPPDSEAVTTEWLTVDPAAAVPLPEMR
ncbi:MAG: hypothetical protein PPP58_11785 [Natronomonas sp.]